MDIALNGPITHVAQRRLTRLNQQILVISAIIAFVIGYSLQSVALVFQVFLAGVVVDALVIVPSWKVWREDGPVQWMKAKEKVD